MITGIPDAEDIPPGNVTKIGITYNLKRQGPFFGEADSEQVEEFDRPETVDALCGALKGCGFETIRLGGDISVAEKIRQERPDFVFNISEGYFGRNRESHIPAILEMADIPYSGSDPLTLALTLDKSMAKKFFRQLGIPTPDYTIIRTVKDIKGVEDKLRYPLIAKPAWEGSSKGIYNTSKIDDRRVLEENVRRLLRKYPDQPVLVETYVPGREVTVGIIGNKPKTVFGIMEIARKVKRGSNDDFIYSLDMKRNWREHVEYVVSPDLGKPLEEKIKNYAILAFNEFGCRDFARMDFRISGDKEAYLLEINPLPGVSPTDSDMVIMSSGLGVCYEDFILSILRSAFSRYHIRFAPKRLARAGLS